MKITYLQISAIVKKIFIIKLFIAFNIINKIFPSDDNPERITSE